MSKELLQQRNADLEKIRAANLAAASRGNRVLVEHDSLQDLARDFGQQLGMGTEELRDLLNEHYMLRIAGIPSRGPIPEKSVRLDLSDEGRTKAERMYLKREYGFPDPTL